ncbi:hypothetical protein EVAR_99516_1 [Eumeta japonica]|uniref:Uncharacterized protein n=1 Tax=Eumeta variegata TaxID=151549 RepID=A0A4C1SDI0_EUMVA|nr:hypothetical protein EVAR_99516_1 [Eumeta japonica]
MKNGSIVTTRAKSWVKLGQPSTSAKQDIHGCKLLLCIWTANGMAAMVKVELEDEDAVMYRESRVQVGHAHLQDSVTDVVWNFKEENDLVLKIEEDVPDEVTIKQELDIKLTVVQPKTLSCPLPPVTSCSHIPALRPAPQHRLSRVAPSVPCLVWSTSFVPKTEVQNGLGKKDSIIPSESDFVDMKRTNNACQTVLKAVLRPLRQRGHVCGQTRAGPVQILY